MGRGDTKQSLCIRKVCRNSSPEERLRIHLRHPSLRISLFIAELNYAAGLCRKFLQRAMNSLFPSFLSGIFPGGYHRGSVGCDKYISMRDGAKRSEGSNFSVSVIGDTTRTYIGSPLTLASRRVLEDAGRRRSVSPRTLRFSYDLQNEGMGERVTPITRSIGKRRSTEGERQRRRRKGAFALSRMNPPDCRSILLATMRYDVKNNNCISFLSHSAYRNLIGLKFYCIKILYKKKNKIKKNV